MTKKTPTKPVAPAPRFDVEQADFPALLERFNSSGCDVESYNVATHMVRRFPTESLALLPMVIAPEQSTSPAIEPEQPAVPQAIKPEKLDFDRNGNTTGHEWAAALLAAKKLKLETGLELPVAERDKLIDKAEQIYKATHPEIKGNDAASNSCRTL